MNPTKESFDFVANSLLHPLNPNHPTENYIKLNQKQIDWFIQTHDDWAKYGIDIWLERSDNPISIYATAFKLLNADKSTINIELKKYPRHYAEEISSLVEQLNNLI